ncbi:zinc-ribbon domain-containing protein [Segatella oulorum]|uniref:Zinc-ribbon domain-containing protein n=1 Tax=Segatella oulorum TaxID=28136 RepID=A0A1T4KXJ9_9BACT|nr:zinc-ribbon domain-containing protein [Segatella oulorum]SJZ47146.1 zinc-ribbon domain-containing protein [Segatella oulorum]
MAIIKCPECGRPVSDKAPFCPNCGVEIAGKVATAQQQPTTSQPQPAPETVTTPPETPKEKKNGTRNIIIVCLVLIAVAVGVITYFYRDAQSAKEQEAYEYAMTANDPAILQAYLDKYTDAPEAHVDSIQAHLQLLMQGDKDWTNAMVSNSKTAFEAYLQAHPNSPHKAEAEHLIDSIDWSAAQRANSVDAFNSYLEDHPNGEHVDEAQNGIRSVNANTVQPDERSMVSRVFNNFFQAINTHDEGALKDGCESILTSFLGKSDATKSDVVTFLHKIWKDDVKNITWQSNRDYAITKKEVGDGEYEYTVKFSALQIREFNDASKNDKTVYKITAKVSPDNLISTFNMAKVVE